MTTWIDACSPNDIETEGMFRLERNGHAYLIFRSPEDEFFCTDGVCTHEHVELAGGMVVEYEIDCPKHASSFDYRTGEALRAPACIDLRTYPTKIDQGRILVGL